MVVAPSILAMVVFSMVSFTVTVAENYDFVAFSVAHNTDFTPSGTEKLKFSVELYNDQEHFNKETGDFTAPVDGLYEFSFGSGGNNPGSVYCYLRAGNPQENVFRILNKNSAYPHASATVMLKMKKGDAASIWVAAGNPVHNSVNDSPMTFFNGKLLKSFEPC